MKREEDTIQKRVVIQGRVLTLRCIKEEAQIIDQAVFLLNDLIQEMDFNYQTVVDSDRLLLMAALQLACERIHTQDARGLIAPEISDTIGRVEQKMAQALVLSSTDILSPADTRESS